MIPSLIISKSGRKSNTKTLPGEIVLKKIVTIAVLLAAMMLQLTPAVGAETGRLKTRVVRSEYRSPFPGDSVQEVKWRFTPDLSLSSSGGERYLVRDEESRVGAWVELIYVSPGTLKGLTAFRLIRGKPVVDFTLAEAENRGVVLVDTVIPADWFNCSEPFRFDEGEKRFKIREKVGSMRLVSRMIVRCREISFDEAVSRGMVSDDNRKLVREERLYLREAWQVLADSEKLVLRQLWSQSDDFWLYEEKGNRRSWRCR